MDGKSKFTIKEVQQALLNEDLEYLKEAYSADPENFQNILKTLNAYVAVGKHKSEDTRVWLYEVVGYRTEDSTASTMAMHNKNIELAKWMYSKFFEFDVKTFRAAVYHCGLDVLEWLLSINCPRDESVFAAAAEMGSMEILVWMKKNGFAWNEEACSKAARGGHFAELMWLREQGCPWNDMTAFACLQAGNVPMMRWVIKNGCPHNLDALIVDSASFGRSNKMRKFLSRMKKKAKAPPVSKVVIDKGFQNLESMFEAMTDVLNNWFSDNAFTVLPDVLMEEEERNDEEDEMDNGDIKQEFVERDGMPIPTGYFSACIWPEKLKELIEKESGVDEVSGAVNGETLSKYFRWKYITMKEHRRVSAHIFENHIASEYHAVSHCTGGDGFEVVVEKSFDLLTGGPREDWDYTRFPAIGHYRFVENEGCCNDVTMVFAEDVTLERLVIPHPVTSIFKEE